MPPVKKKKKQPTDASRVKILSMFGFGKPAKKVKKRKDELDRLIEEANR